MRSVKEASAGLDTWYPPGHIIYLGISARGYARLVQIVRSVELELLTNNDANGFSFPEYQLVAQFLGICIGQCWRVSDYVITTTSHPDSGYLHRSMLASIRLCYNYYYLVLCLIGVVRYSSTAPCSSIFRALFCSRLRGPITVLIRVLQ